MARERLVTAAGGVVWRRRSSAPRDPARSGAAEGTARRAVEVLLVHRPRYDDWTFPKGKPDPGEDLTATAVREVAEETGQVVRLGHPLPDARYTVSAGPKVVSYWVARSTGVTDPPFTPNKEVDELRWVRPRKARRLLTYEHDIDLLEAFTDLRDEQRHRSRTLVVLRHAKATAREDWAEGDEWRPLAAKGKRQSTDLVDVLGAYGVKHVVTSPAVRCVQTVQPYAEHSGRTVQLDERLGEGTRADSVRRTVDALLDRKKPTVLCTHRPTLPWVWAALDLPDVDLAPGGGVVVHHRKGKVITTEPLGRPQPVAAPERV
ncbi:NUDIX domain-containing protein [Aeromicrobium sp. CTD01-1L150]|uniref:NUDIX hydrolase n=1 Tax=Aeromicrobium sp. CTD01-1L150 TaxID=3341830 RepID=UPI0035C11527